MKFTDLETEKERDLESRFCSEVKRRGGVAKKLQWVGSAGAPDRIVLAPGPRIAFVELKRPDGAGRVSKLQARELRLLRRMGFDARVVSSDEEADQFLLEFFG